MTADVTDSGDGSDTPGDGDQPTRMTLEEFQRRYKEVEGDPEKVNELVRELVLGMIDEVRERALAEERGADPPA